MDDFIALLIAVAACTASVVLMKIGVFALTLFGAVDTIGALGPTMQAISGIGVGILTYRRAIRAEGREAAR